MKERDQVDAIAKLDGFVHRVIEEQEWWEKDGKSYRRDGLPDYLHSFDAIIPVIVESGFQSVIYEQTWRDATPAKLCKALLGISGRWAE
jgi:hypothetical protein